MRGKPAVIVFARAPLPGRVKTRLIPALGPEGAAHAYQCFLLDTLARLRNLPADVIIAAADPDDTPALVALLRHVRLDAEVTAQVGADLGERISHCAAEALAQGSSPVAVMGTDSPDLPTALILEGLRLAAERDVVLGPCRDGGFYLVALRRAVPALFSHIEWSAETTLRDTIRRADALGLSRALLDEWYDVDTPGDLELLHARLGRQVLAGEPVPCRRTWDCLCDLPESGCQ